MGLILRQTTTPNSGTTLSVKGSTLTYAEADGNFTYLMTNMSGSRVSITGPTSVTGSLTVSNGITGSFSGSLAGTIAYTQGGNSFGGNSTIGLNDNYSLSVNAGTSTRLFISSSGNIGIGTTSPNRLLTLSGSTSAYASFNASSYNNYTIGASSIGFFIQDDTNTAKRMAISQSTNHITQMSIFSDATTYNDDYEASLYIGNYQTNIASNNRAIGYRLLTSNAGSNVESIFNIQYAYSSTGDYNPPSSYSTIFSLTKAGQITSLGTYSVTVGGANRDLYVDNTGVIGYVSSNRASKNNITPINDVSWLNSLDAVSFNRRKKDEEGNYLEETYDELEYGLIAEDVEAVNDELCFYDIVDGEKELRGVHYHKLIVPMLKMIQELKAEIDILKNK